MASEGKHTAGPHRVEFSAGEQPDGVVVAAGLAQNVDVDKTRNARLAAGRRYDRHLQVE